MKYILIGPKVKKDKLGGAVILFEQMLGYIDDIVDPYVILYTNAGSSSFTSYFNLIIKFLRVAKQRDICILNVSQNGVKYLFPIVFFIGKILKLRLVLRVFGSHFKDDIGSGIKRSFYLLLLKRISLLCLETQGLVNFARKQGLNSYHFINCRKVTASPNSLGAHNYARRFVYIGRVTREKGVLELIDIFDSLDANHYNLEIYGPVEEGLEDIKQSKYYIGVLKNNEIEDILKLNDVLVFPSYYVGEGYPGILIESVLFGRPIIASDWNYNKEVVGEDVCWFYESKNWIQLKEIITGIDSMDYCMKAKNTKNYKYIYDSDVVHSNFFGLLQNIN